MKLESFSMDRLNMTQIRGALFLSSRSVQRLMGLIGLGATATCGIPKTMLFVDDINESQDVVG